MITGRDDLDLSVVILARNESENLSSLVPKISAVAERLGIKTEILVVDDSRDGTPDVAAKLGCRVLRQTDSGYGAALRQGLGQARGKFIVTMDADHSHEPNFLRHMWAVRDSADVVIASRYVTAGRAYMPVYRKLMSVLLNRVFARLLGLPFRDLSSGYRLYRRTVIESLDSLEGRNFDVLQEIVIKAYTRGWTIREVPMVYRPRHLGKSNASAVRFAMSYVRTFWRLWKLRNDANSCDYDARAFNSWIPAQRYWQRKRVAIITDLLDRNGRALDVGCGSSQIIRSLPGMVGLDVNSQKLRFLRGNNPWLVRGTLFRLPFKEGRFSVVVCSQVIEHVEKSRTILEELRRVLAPGGTLVLGTPDYGTWLWNFIEYWYGKLLPGGYAHEHISHYTRDDLVSDLSTIGFEVLTTRYVFGSELILEARRL